jgi:hypothetical protein
MAIVMTAELLIIIINYRNKVLTIQSLLTSIGFNKNKILIIEGKGRVILTENLLENLGEIRSKNRRVDLLLVKKNSFKQGFTTLFRTSTL